ncbi:alanine dehydrogenase [Alicyclobacillus tolerans]|uniref:Alanine dehydrogenase n=2 Tax=Alicyclobacillus tolerans TaxID=90970 RepID=A0A1M6L3T6_9BACL|nr:MULTISPECIES: alanine dehydrogenase [Alicyclobacillus]MDP9727581.1 alanine dehydrogenase [Alicyclobacillus tengchongensis]QRF24011.1 alanine dehydrogenase [Alicyclobacillus sp. TC]SHJ65885.1 alanine dehydrogenase [Alicyclobacillus montanus]
MIVGVPKEIKNNENRVAITPAGVHALKLDGHTVLVEAGAGLGSGFTDSVYEEAGAKIVPSAADVWGQAGMVMKVKEPLPEEFGYFRQDLTLFTYLHLAPEPELTKALMDSGCTAIAYETVQLPDRSLPLLSPMSEVAGRMSIQIGAHFLEKAHGGRGELLGGVPGVPPSRVVIVGGGIVGTNAARMAMGLGASVTILDTNLSRLRYLDDVFQGRIRTIMSNAYNLRQEIEGADLLVGAVLIPGSRAPKLVTAEMVQGMNPGGVIVDVAIDQGGSIETIDRITTHDQPVFEKYGVLHYSVANMPGAVPRTSTLALTNVTIPYALQLANLGAEKAVAANEALAKGVNVYRGHVTYQAVADSLGLPYTPLSNLVS